MGKDLVVRSINSATEFDSEQIEVLRNTIFKGYTDNEMKFALAVCNRTGLDPFVRQIHFTKRANKRTGNSDIVMTTGIDGFRLTANRSHAYAGSDDPAFKLVSEKPVEATVTVYKIVQGIRCPFTATARWVEFYPGDGPDGFMWRKMPFVMLGKCAEAQALRKAFPAELSNIYSHEEMAQSSNDRAVIQTKADQVNEILALDSSPDLEIDASFSDEPDFLTEAASGLPPEDLGEFKITFGKKYINRRLKEISVPELKDYSTWLSSQGSKHASVLEAVEKMQRYLEEAK